MRRLAVPAGAALFVALGVALLGPGLRRSWLARVAVVGHSMEPTLLDGDWLLVDPDAYLRQAPQAGDLVVVRDPRSPKRVLVKRVVGVKVGVGLTLAGDHPAHRNDGTAIGSVPSDSVVGRPWLRYWPAERLGRIS
jgi:nickel-type superoxide dismutase maturation protease